MTPQCPDCQNPLTEFLQRGSDIMTGHETEVWSCPECGGPFAIEIQPIAGDRDDAPDRGDPL